MRNPARSLPSLKPTPLSIWQRRYKANSAVSAAGRWRHIHRRRGARPSFGDVGAVLFVFCADVLSHFRVRHQVQGVLDAEGLREGLGIVEGDLNIQMAEIAAVVALL